MSNQERRETDNLDHEGELIAIYEKQKEVMQWLVTLPDGKEADEVKRTIIDELLKSGVPSSMAPVSPTPEPIKEKESSSQDDKRLSLELEAKLDDLKHKRERHELELQMKADHHKVSIQRERLLNWLMGIGASICFMAFAGSCIALYMGVKLAVLPGSAIVSIVIWLMLRKMLNPKSWKVIEKLEETGGDL
ncbi:MAG: hypothetical protein IPN76_14110 [Saprospiraceae bacterium]|nr:hypothetical protein [Saprospiraceae bacterium]